MGPTLAMCRSAYSAKSWAQNNNFFSMSSQGIQEWIVPETGNYSIEVAGATGGTFSGQSTSAGRGYKLKAEFTLFRGWKLFILVGQKGSQDTGSDGCGGGGGTFVGNGTSLASSNPIIVAGGGGGLGGCSFQGYSSNLDANSGIDGRNDQHCSNGASSVTGGRNGYGGNAGPSSQSFPAGGGGGFYGDGQSVTQNDNQVSYGGRAFRNGGAGTFWPYYTNKVYGGFGGGGSSGGCGGGGGGGYSGGAGATNDGYNGGGGGSFSSSNYRLVYMGYNGYNMDGYVTINFVGFIKLKMDLCSFNCKRLRFDMNVLGIFVYLSYSY